MMYHVIPIGIALIFDIEQYRTGRTFTNIRGSDYLICLNVATLLYMSATFDTYCATSDRTK